MVKYYRTDDRKIHEEPTIQDGVWVQMVNPSVAEGQMVADALDMDVEDVLAALDEEESSRIELQDGYTLILVDIPSIEIRHEKESYTTIPLGILITSGEIVTVCTEDTPVLQAFLNNRVREFSTKKKLRFVYQILYRIAVLYQSDLRIIDKMRTEIEERVGDDTEEVDLIALHELESTLVYFATSLRANGVVLDRPTRYKRLGGTSGCARPKIMTEIDGENWIIKFPAHVDKKDVGKMEYDYSLCAKACGIVMSETRLFSSDICPGYFGTKRFDRRIEKNEIKRAHMLTAAALLELDFNQPSLDYHELMKLTKILTRDCTEDVENMYRRMCFNVFAHNRDDHSKNFTYIYNEKDDMWRLSPAYDLTYSNTYYSEHTTTVDGNGKNPGKKELVAVGVQAGMKKTYCERVAEEIRLCVNEKLEHYLK